MNIYIVSQSEGEYEDNYVFNVKAFKQEIDALNFKEFLECREEKERKECEDSNEYMDYSSFYIEKIELN